MLQKLNKFLNSSIVISGLMFLIGLILIIYPEMSFDTLTYVLSAMLIINGLYFIIEKESSILFSGFLMLGVIELLLGIVVILNPNIIKTLLPLKLSNNMIAKVIKEFIPDSNPSAGSVAIQIRNINKKKNTTQQLLDLIEKEL